MITDGRRPGRDPAPPRPGSLRGAVAGSQPRQVQVVHDPGAGRQLPHGTGPRGAYGRRVRPWDRRASGVGRAGAGDHHLVSARGGVRGDEVAAPGAASAGQPGRRAGYRHSAPDPGTGRRPPASRLRAAWYGYAFNAQQRRSRAPDPVTASALAWLARASLPVSQLSATGARAGPARWCPRRRRSARTSRCEAVLAGTNPAEPAQKMNGTSILVERLYTG